MPLERLIDLLLPISSKQLVAGRPDLTGLQSRSLVPPPVGRQMISKDVSKKGVIRLINQR
jgi:hypothetical protein